MTRPAASSLRRWFRRAAVACAAALFTAPSFSADWPQYRGPRGDGSSDDTGVAKNFNPRPRLVWKIPIGEGFGTFAVVADKAFIFVDRGGSETLVCLNASTGKEIWARPIGGTLTDNQGGSNPR